MKLWNSFLINYSWTMAMMTMEMGTGFLGVPRQIGVLLSEAENLRFFSETGNFWVSSFKVRGQYGIVIWMLLEFTFRTEKHFISANNAAQHSTKNYTTWM